jgi:hypothetical protein
MFRFTVLPLLLVASFATYSASAQANPVGIITVTPLNLAFGILRINTSFSTDTYSTQRGAITLLGTVDCHPCLSGQTIGLNFFSNTLGNSDWFGSITVNGNTYFATNLNPPPPKGANLTGSIGAGGGGAVVPDSNASSVLLIGTFQSSGGASALGGPFSVNFQWPGYSVFFIEQ